jgi:hypothetical protein
MLAQFRIDELSEYLTKVPASSVIARLRPNATDKMAVFASSG